MKKVIALCAYVCGLCAMCLCLWALGFAQGSFIEDKAKAAFDKGMAFYYQVSYYFAVTEFNKAITDNPNFADAYFYRGASFDKMGNYRKAIDDYTKTLEINPKYPKVYLSRGLAYANYGKENNFTQAIADYNKAIEIDPKDGQAHYNRALAYFALKDFDKSWADIDKAKELGGVINPEFVEKLKAASGRDK